MGLFDFFVDVAKAAATGAVEGALDNPEQKTTVDDLPAMDHEGIVLPENSIVLAQSPGSSLDWSILSTETLGASAPGTDIDPILCDDGELCANESPDVLAIPELSELILNPKLPSADEVIAARTPKDEPKGPLKREKGTTVTLDIPKAPTVESPHTATAETTESAAVVTEPSPVLANLPEDLPAGVAEILGLNQNQQAATVDLSLEPVAGVKFPVSLGLDPANGGTVTVKNIGVNAAQSVVEDGGGLNLTESVALTPESVNTAFGGSITVGTGNIAISRADVIGRNGKPNSNTTTASVTLGDPTKTGVSVGGSVASSQTPSSNNDPLAEALAQAENPNPTVSAVNKTGTLAVAGAIQLGTDDQITLGHTGTFSNTGLPTGQTNAAVTLIHTNATFNASGQLNSNVALSDNPGEVGNQFKIAVGSTATLGTPKAVPAITEGEAPPVPATSTQPVTKPADPTTLGINFSAAGEAGKAPVTTTNFTLQNGGNVNVASSVVVKTNQAQPVPGARTSDEPVIGTSVVASNTIGGSIGKDNAATTAQITTGLVAQDGLQPNITNTIAVTKPAGDFNFSSTTTYQTHHVLLGIDGKSLRAEGVTELGQSLNTNSTLNFTAGKITTGLNTSVLSQDGQAAKSNTSMNVGYKASTFSAQLAGSHATQQRIANPDMPGEFTTSNVSTLQANTAFPLGKEINFSAVGRSVITPGTAAVIGGQATLAVNQEHLKGNITTTVVNQPTLPGEKGLTELQPSAVNAPTLMGQTNLTFSAPLNKHQTLTGGAQLTYGEGLLPTENYSLGYSAKRGTHNFGIQTNYGTTPAGETAGLQVNSTNTFGPHITNTFSAGAQFGSHAPNYNVSDVLTYQLKPGNSIGFTNAFNRTPLGDNSSHGILYQHNQWQGSANVTTGTGQPPGYNVKLTGPLVPYRPTPKPIGI